MYEFINDLLSNLPADMEGNANAPASSHLSNVNLEDTKLDDKQSNLFHHFMEKLIFLFK